MTFIYNKTIIVVKYPSLFTIIDLLTSFIIILSTIFFSE